MTDQPVMKNNPGATEQSTGEATASTAMPQIAGTDQFVAADQATETGSSAPSHQTAMANTPPPITYQPTSASALSTVAQQPTVASMLTTPYEPTPTSNLSTTVNQPIATSITPSGIHPITTPDPPAAIHGNLTANPSTPASQLTMTTTPSTGATQTPATGTTSLTVQQSVVAGPSTAMAQTPVDPSTIPSAVPPPYTELRAHTAKCEKCNQKNRGVGWQCTKCIVKFCQACVDVSGEARLRLFHPPCFKTEEPGRARRRRKRVRDSTDESSKDVGSGASKSAQGEQSTEGKPSKASKLEKSEEQRESSGPVNAAPATETLPDGANYQQQNPTVMRFMEPDCPFVLDQKPMKKVRKQRAKPATPSGRPNTRSQARAANYRLSGAVDDIIEKKILDNKLSPQTKEEKMHDVEQYSNGTKLCGPEADQIPLCCNMVTEDTTCSKISPESEVRPKVEEASSTPISTPVNPTQPAVDTLEDVSELPLLPDGISSVVVNAGIIGLCIAYKLAQRNYETGNEQPVVVLDHLPTPEGAEMNAGRIVPSNRWMDERFSKKLAKLSFSEWKKLLSQNKVGDYVGYCSQPSEELPCWLRGEDDESVRAEITHGNSYTINPARMVTWLKNACREYGVHFVKCQRLLQITDDYGGKVTGVKYQTPNSINTRQICCSNVILALGDYTEEVLQDIYGTNGQLRFNFYHEAQDWMTLHDPWPESEPRLFRADKHAGFPMDIVNREDGTFWIGGGIVKCPQPKRSSPNARRIERIHEATKKILKGPSEDGVFDAKILKQGRNFNGRTQSGTPIISKIPISYLDRYRVWSQEDLSHPCGLFLCAGYGEDGLALGMGMAHFLVSLMKCEALEKHVAAFGVARYLEADQNVN
ncbi:MAG: hypothetical protein Q9165_006519 [Trypethelium subeluteriae]